MWAATRRSERAFFPQEGAMQHKYLQFGHGFRIVRGDDHSQGSSFYRSEVSVTCQSAKTLMMTRKPKSFFAAPWNGSQ
jgi:hypothetical protein